MVNVEWHGQDYLHLKWHVVCPGLATPDLKEVDKTMDSTGIIFLFHEHAV